ncbi:MAG: tetratricopeptide repeat protein [Deltaproteobacteria bacterium]|nr:tetratricopeptide repeat protein [Deltaproteobacteria bacterium]MBI5902032.1 tetratricopeptide repeat protein [Deltaproteobacteria bacterium]
MKALIRENSAAFLLLTFMALFVAGCAAGPTAAQRSYTERKAAEAARAGFEALESEDYRKAIEYFTQALTLNRSVDNRAGEVKDLINIGRVYIALNDVKGAETHLSEAVSLAAGEKEEAYLSAALASLAKVRYIQGDLHKALTEIERSLEIDSRLGTRSGSKLNLKARIYIDTGKLEEAMGILKQAYEWNSSVENKQEVANTLRQMALISEARGKIAEAKKLYDEAYTNDSAVGDSARIADDLESMAELELASGQPEKAAFLYERSFVVSLNAGHLDDALARLYKIIQVYKKTGNNDKVKSYEKIRDGVIARKERGKSGR